MHCSITSELVAVLVSFFCTQCSETVVVFVTFATQHSEPVGVFISKAAKCSEPRVDRSVSQFSLATFSNDLSNLRCVHAPPYGWRSCGTRGSPPLLSVPWP